jgi:hypothetical protein
MLQHQLHVYYATQLLCTTIRSEIQQENHIFILFVFTQFRSIRHPSVTVTAYSSSLCLEACDMGKISSGAALCLAISAVLFLEFETKLVFYNNNC